VTATGVPGNGSVQVLQGRADYAGTSDLAPNTKVIAAYPATEVNGGPVTQAIDTSYESFVRTQVLDASGTVVALSNPVWLLRSAPPGGIPGPRAA
jgi:hypothetical protein